MYNISIFDVDAKMQFLGSVDFSGKPWEAINTEQVRSIIGDGPRKVMMIFSEGTGIICGYGSYVVRPGNLKFENKLINKANGDIRQMGWMYGVDVYLERGGSPLKVNWGRAEWDEWFINFYEIGDTFMIEGVSYEVNVEQSRTPSEYILIDTSF